MEPQIKVINKANRESWIYIHGPQIKVKEVSRKKGKARLEYYLHTQAQVQVQYLFASSKSYGSCLS